MAHVLGIEIGGTKLQLGVSAGDGSPLVALERNFAGQSPGRKHWANAYSAVFAGAGVMRRRRR